MSIVDTSRDFLNGFAAESVPFGVEDTSAYRAGCRGTGLADEPPAEPYPAGMEDTSTMATIDDDVRNATDELVRLGGVRGVQWGRAHSWCYVVHVGSPKGVRHDAWHVRVILDDGESEQAQDEDFGECVAAVKRKIARRRAPRPLPPLRLSTADAFSDELEAMAETDNGPRAA